MHGQVLAVQQKEDKLKKTSKDLQAERDQVHSFSLSTVQPVFHLSCFLKCLQLHCTPMQAEVELLPLIDTYVTSCISKVIAPLKKVMLDLTTVLEQEVLVVHRPCKTRYRLLCGCPKPSVLNHAALTQLIP